MCLQGKKEVVKNIYIIKNFKQRKETVEPLCSRLKNKCGLYIKKEMNECPPVSNVFLKNKKNGPAKEKKKEKRQNIWKATYTPGLRS